MVDLYYLILEEERKKINPLYSVACELLEQFRREDLTKNEVFSEFDDYARRELLTFDCTGNVIPWFKKVKNQNQISEARDFLIERLGIQTR